MRIAFFIHTPGQAYLFSHAIRMLKDKDHKVMVIARGGAACELLTKAGISHNTYGKASKTAYGKVLQLPLHFIRSFRFIKRFMPDILISAGIVEACSSTLLRKPCIIFDDNDNLGQLFYSYKPFATAILTPSCFRKDLGKKQIRFAGYKELAYLHPNYFQPDPSIYNGLGIDRNEKYVIVRFNAFGALHDVGQRGFSLPNKYQLVKDMERYARVFISSEGSLPQDLGSYKLPIPFERIHHALYYAQMLVSDTATMTTEAAVLGTPAVCCTSSFGPNDIGNFIELERKYDLIYSFREPDKAIQRALELLQLPDLKEQWAKKRERLLADKIDVTQFMVDFIENYPQSFYRYKEESKSRL